MLRSAANAFYGAKLRKCAVAIANLNATWHNSRLICIAFLLPSCSLFWLKPSLQPLPQLYSTSPSLS